LHLAAQPPETDRLGRHATVMQAEEEVLRLHPIDGLQDIPESAVSAGIGTDIAFRNGGFQKELATVRRSNQEIRRTAASQLRLDRDDRETTRYHKTVQQQLEPSASMTAVITRAQPTDQGVSVRDRALLDQPVDKRANAPRLGSSRGVQVVRSANQVTGRLNVGRAMSSKALMTLLFLLKLMGGSDGGVCRLEAILRLWDNASHQTILARRARIYLRACAANRA
jgi:hypothetical protein